MTTVEAVEKWLVDHNIEYDFYMKTKPYQFRIIDPKALIIVCPGPDLDEHKVVVWNTRTYRRRFDTELDIADPQFFEKFETALK